MPNKVWDEITYPFLNFNGCTVEVQEWISNFISHFIMDVIIIHVEIKLNHVSKRGPSCHSLAMYSSLWIYCATGIKWQQKCRSLCVFVLKFVFCAHHRSQWKPPCNLHLLDVLKHLSVVFGGAMVHLDIPLHTSPYCIIMKKPAYQHVTYF